MFFMGDTAFAADLCIPGLLRCTGTGLTRDQHSESGAPFHHGSSAERVYMHATGADHCPLGASSSGFHLDDSGVPLLAKAAPPAAVEAPRSSASHGSRSGQSGSSQPPPRNADAATLPSPGLLAHDSVRVG